MMNLRAELAAGKIVVESLCPDMAKHKIISEFALDGRLLSRRIEYVFGIPAPVKDTRLLPQLFFEAVNAGAFAEAASYLAPVLRSVIPAGGEGDFFRGFFGDFVFAYPEKGGATALICKKQIGYETKLFTAEIENGYIVNFTDS